MLWGGYSLKSFVEGSSLVIATRQRFFCRKTSGIGERGAGYPPMKKSPGVVEGDGMGTS